MLQELHRTDVEMHPVLSLSMMSLWYESSSSKVTKATFGGPHGFTHMAPLQGPCLWAPRVSELDLNAKHTGPIFSWERIHCFQQIFQREFACKS